MPNYLATSLLVGHTCDAHVRSAAHPRGSVGGGLAGVTDGDCAHGNDGDLMTMRMRMMVVVDGGGDNE